MNENLKSTFGKLGKQSIVIPIFYMILIFLLSSIPGDESSPVSSFFQNINPGLQNSLHIPLFAFLVVLWSVALQNYDLTNKFNLLISTCLSWIYSIFDELHQFFVPGRYPGFIDIVLNTIGIVVAAIYLKYFLQNIQNK